MKRIIATLFILGLLLALTPWAAEAQPATSNPPGQISYQGYLTDANGFPLATNNPVNYNVQFRIWNQSSGGSNMWGELQVVTVDRGYFTVMLGNGSSLPGVPSTNNLSGIFSGTDASDRYLEITVQGLAPGDPPIVPRLRLLASPYSYLASRSLVAVSALSVDASTAIADANLSANVALRNASQNFTGVNTFSNAVRISGGNTLEFGAGVPVKEVSAGKIGYQSFTAGALDIVGAGTNFGSRRIQFWAEAGANFTGGGNFNGNLSIGGGTPVNRLEVNVPNVGDGVNVYGTAPAYYLSNPSKVLGAVWGLAGSPGHFSTDAAAGDVVLHSYGSGKLLLQNGLGASAIAVAANNSVGIGTPAPGAKLDVRGDVKMGAAGNLFAAGGQENLRIVKGIVRADGTIFNGTGFTVTKTGTGSYTLNFTTPFADVPAVSITPTGPPPCTSSWNAGNSTSLLVYTWSGSAATDEWWMFIAVGAR